jgi:hypothetical protein
MVGGHFRLKGRTTLLHQRGPNVVKVPLHLLTQATIDYQRDLIRTAFVGGANVGDSTHNYPGEPNDFRPLSAASRPPLSSPARQQQAQNNKAEFERSLSYTAEVGAVFKGKVEITEHCMQAVPRG